MTKSRQRRQTDQRPRKLLSDRSGLAATEFALIAPLLVGILLAIVEACLAFQASQKLNLTGNLLADLVAQEVELSPSDVDNLFKGMEQVTDSLDGDVGLTLISVSLSSSGAGAQPVVDWSRDNDGNTPLGAGTPYGRVAIDNFLDDQSSIIVAEVRFDYQTPIVRHLAPSIKFDDVYLRWPRRSRRVDLIN